jgi:DNA repair exonuclease SbcCD ATPase subunit
VKRVEFKKIKIKNFLSIGSKELSLDFKSGVFLITGENKDMGGRNGVGKSSIIESIYWCLFGSTIRDIKKDDIVHNRHKEKCEVVLDFSIKNKEETDYYTITRSLNPSKLEIIKNKEDITLSSIIKSDEFIKKLIGANEQVFQNAVIMTANNTIPFMAQKKVDKRKFIEGIFNIGIFGDLLLQIRSDFNEKKKEYDIKMASFIEVQKNIEIYKKQIEKNTRDKELKINLITEKIDINKNLINKFSNSENILILLEESKNNIQKTETMIIKLEEGLEKTKTKLSDSEKQLIEFDFSLKTLSSQLEFYEKQNGQCPTCKRKFKDHNDIDDKEINSLKDKINDIKKQFLEKTEIVNSLKQKQNIIKSSIIKNRNLNSKLNSDFQKLKLDSNEVNHLNEKNKELLETIKNIESEKDSMFDLLENTQKQIIELEEILKDYQKSLQVLENCKFIVSEEGVKTYIIKKMMKLFNQQLNVYLKRLDAPCTCSFDEMFEDTIHNIEGKECSYFNFSGGERKRIDIAILFMFQDILRSQTGVSFSLNMYDELFDSAIDEGGISKVIQILEEKVEKYKDSIYIVSHNKSAFNSNFNEVIQIQKKDGITSFVC